MVQIGITTVNLIYEDTKVRFLELLDPPVYMGRLNYTCAQAVLRLGSSGLLEDRFSHNKANLGQFHKKSDMPSWVVLFSNY